MRAVFTLDLPSKAGGKYPDDGEISGLVRDWDPRRIEMLSERDIKAMLVAQGTNTDVGNVERRLEVEDRNSPTHGGAATGDSNETDTQTNYRRLAAPLFREMPEVAAVESNYVIFLGYLSDDQTLFVITRVVQGQITFRLLHRELPKLQSSTEKMIRKVRSSKLGNQQLKVADPTVVIYERNFDHVILTGRVITSPYNEARRVNFKDFLVMAITLLLFIPAAYVADNYAPPLDTRPSFWYETIDRGSTALLTAALISALSFIHTWVQIAKKKLIDWSVAVDRRKASS